MRRAQMLSIPQLIIVATASIGSRNPPCRKTAKPSAICRNMPGRSARAGLGSGPGRKLSKQAADTTKVIASIEQTADRASHLG